MFPAHYDINCVSVRWRHPQIRGDQFSTNGKVFTAIGVPDSSRVEHWTGQSEIAGSVPAWKIFSHV